jgi:GNAT superfamily N-acetyltransferase
MGVTVRQVPVTVSRPLRNRVLRPHRLDDVPAYDADPGAIHLAAFLDDAVVGCATIFPSPSTDDPSAWQLRGMAVDPARQGEGIGRAVVAAAIAVARGAGARQLWANARVSALAFYEATGWQPRGEVFVHGDSGLPHKVITLALTDVP